MQNQRYPQLLLLLLNLILTTIVLPKLHCLQNTDLIRIFNSLRSTSLANSNDNENVREWTSLLTDMHALNLGPCKKLGGDLTCQRIVTNSYCAMNKDECFCLPGHVSVREEDGKYSCKQLLTDLQCRVDSDCVHIKDSSCHPGAGSCTCPSFMEFSLQHHSCKTREVNEDVSVCRECKKAGGVCLTNGDDYGRDRGEILNGFHKIDPYSNTLRRHRDSLTHSCACPRNSAVPKYLSMDSTNICNGRLVNIGGICDEETMFCKALNARCLYSKAKKTLDNKMIGTCDCLSSHVTIYQKNLGYFECLPKVHPHQQNMMTSGQKEFCRECEKIQGICYHQHVGDSVFSCSCPRFYESNEGINSENYSSQNDKHLCFSRKIDVECFENRLKICYRLHKVFPMSIHQSSLLRNTKNILVHGTGDVNTSEECLMRHTNNITLSKDDPFCWEAKSLEILQACGLSKISFRNGILYYGTIKFISNQQYKQEDSLSIPQFNVEFMCSINIENFEAKVYLKDLSQMEATNMNSLTGKSVNTKSLDSSTHIPKYQHPKEAIIISLVDANGNTIVETSPNAYVRIGIRIQANHNSHDQDDEGYVYALPEMCQLSQWNRDEDTTLRDSSIDPSTDLPITMKQYQRQLIVNFRALCNRSHELDVPEQVFNGVYNDEILLALEEQVLPDNRDDDDVTRSNVHFFMSQLFRYDLVDNLKAQYISCTLRRCRKKEYCIRGKDESFCHDRDYPEIARQIHQNIESRSSNVDRLELEKVPIRLARHVQKINVKILKKDDLELLSSLNKTSYRNFDKSPPSLADTSTFLSNNKMILLACITAILSILCIIILFITFFRVMKNVQNSGHNFTATIAHGSNKQETGSLYGPKQQDQVSSSHLQVLQPFIEIRDGDTETTGQFLNNHQNGLCWAYSTPMESLKQTPHESPDFNEPSTRNDFADFSIENNLSTFRRANHTNSTATLLRIPNSQKHIGNKNKQLFLKTLQVDDYLTPQKFHQGQTIISMPNSPNIYDPTGTMNRRKANIDYSSSDLLGKAGKHCLYSDNNSCLPTVSLKNIVLSSKTSIGQENSLGLT